MKTRVRIALFLLAVTVSGQSVDTNAPSTKSSTINPQFSGMAIEWGQVKNFFMLTPTSNKANDVEDPSVATFNPLILQLLKNIIDLQEGPAGSDKMTLRIGGKSANNIWYLPSNLPPFDLSLTDIVPIQEFHFKLLDMAADIIGIKMSIGLSMRRPAVVDNYNPSFLEGVKKFMKPKNVLNLELGNEPDLYVKNGFRPATYTPAEFFTETQALIDYIKPILPDFKLSGPSYAYPWTESGDFDSYIQKFAGQVDTFTYHRYDIRGCGNVTSLEALMGVPKIDQYNRYEKAINTLKATGKPGNVAWNEGGTASCGGIEGTSNVWGSALWAIDASLQASWIGVYEINFSGSPQAKYGPIQKDEITGKLNTAATYYALIAMKLIAKGINPKVYDVPNNIPNLKIWRVDNGNGIQTVIIINKNFNPTPAALLDIIQPTGSGSDVHIVHASAPGGAADKDGPYRLSGITIDEDTGLATGISTEEKMSVADGKVQVTVQPETFSIIRFGGGSANILDPFLAIKQFNPALVGGSSSSAKFQSSVEVLVLVVLVVLINTMF